jgi:hypothetical protein
MWRSPIESRNSSILCEKFYPEEEQNWLPRVMTVRSVFYALATLLVVSSLVTSAAGQATAIYVTLSIGQTALPIGQTDIVDVTVRNVVNSSVQLFFVGLRFDWNKPTSYFIGGNSDKGTVLALGFQITYPIPVQVPGNVTPGTYKLNTYVTYSWFTNGSWTTKLAALWVASVQLAYPQTTQQSQTTQAAQATQTTFQSGPNPSLRTVAVVASVAVVAVAGIGVGLARYQVRSRAQREEENKPDETPKEA